MEHFKLKASFEEFFPYLKTQIKPMDRHKVCIVYQPVEEVQDIYISTEDEVIRDAIASRFELVACDSPYKIYKAHEGEYMVRGNASLMEVK